MNSLLARMYNTADNLNVLSGASSDDVEKLAEAELLNEFLTHEGADIDKLDGDTIMKVAADLFGEDSALVKAAAEPFEGKETSEEEKKEEEAKKKEEPTKEGEGEGTEKEEEKEEEEAEKKAADDLANADFMGRVAAHSFLDEQARLVKAAQLEQVKQAKLEKLAGASDVEQDDAFVNAIAAEIEKRVQEILKEAGLGEAVKGVGKEVAGLAGEGGAKAKELVQGAGKWLGHGGDVAEAKASLKGGLTERLTPTARLQKTPRMHAEEIWEGAKELAKTRGGKIGIGAGLAAGGVAAGRASKD